MAAFEIKDGVAIIPEGTTEIGSFAFKDCTGLTSVVIPASVTKIGGFAFEGCSGLTSVVIPEGVTDIAYSAFEGCTGLTSITIPASVTKIGSGAFKGCTGLTSIVVAEGNKVYDSRENCNAIIETATNRMVLGCTSTVIPEGVTGIGDDAFNGYTGLTSMVIPEGVTDIGDSAFKGCTGLTNIVIPEGVTEIKSDAFSGCTGLTSIVFPASVTKLGMNFFEGCSGLTSIVVAEGNKVYDSRDNCNAIIETATNELIAGCGSTIIPEGVTKLAPCVFMNCTSLSSIVIPEGVTEIGNYVFCGCSGLTSIVVAEGNNVYDSRDNCNAIIETATTKLIAGCCRTIIPEGVTEIGERAFEGCTGLTSITIPEGVTKIGSAAFKFCSGLTSIMVPASVTEISYSAFSGCSGLTNVEILGAIKELPNAFTDCTSLETISLPAGVKGIHERDFRGCDKLKTIYVPAKKKDYYVKRLPEELHALIVEQEPVKKVKKSTVSKNAPTEPVKEVKRPAVPKLAPVSHKFTINVDAERIGTHYCNPGDSQLEVILPLIEKYKQGQLTAQEKSEIYDIYDLLVCDDYEYYDFGTIKKITVKQGRKSNAVNLDTITVTHEVGAYENREYCIVSYYKWPNQTLVSAEPVKLVTFEPEKLTIKCVKAPFAEGDTFQQVEYAGRPLYFDTDAAPSPAHHLKLYKRNANGEFDELVDFFVSDLCD